jgi:hypothetical protein
VLYLKVYLRDAKQVENKTPLAFLYELHAKSGLERKALRFTYSRLNSLLRTLEVRTWNQNFWCLWYLIDNSSQSASNAMLYMEHKECNIIRRTIVDWFNAIDTTPTPLNPILESNPYRSHPFTPVPLLPLQVTTLDQYNSLSHVSNFVTLLATYMEGFAVITEPQVCHISSSSPPLLLILSYSSKRQ